VSAKADFSRRRQIDGLSQLGPGVPALFRENRMSRGGADVKYRCAIDMMRRRYDPKRHARSSLLQKSGAFPPSEFAGRDERIFVGPIRPHNAVQFIKSRSRRRVRQVGG
jgi:hypothetical protein